jgi:radical SAM superfamily enzyme YgiQ (UPF0313 family)
MVGISAYTETYLNGVKIAAIAKQVIPDAIVVMGGAHASVMHEEVLKEKDIDVVAIGEGEYTMLDLANCLLRSNGSLAKIKGIAYKENSIVIKTPERPFIKDSDVLPVPARELFPIHMYDTPATVLISRGGCPANCRFCAVNSIWKGRCRFRQPENIVNEIIAIFQKFHLREIIFADDTFTLNRELVIKLCDMSQKIRQLFPWRWMCATRVNLVDRELLKLMHDAGCYNITFGVEAGSQKILDSIGKKITLDQVRQAVKLTLEAGIQPMCSFMFPHPEDTEESVHAQMRFMRELNEWAPIMFFPKLLRVPVRIF